MNSIIKLALFATAGMLVGVGLGVLLAPDAGKETRRKLNYASGNLKKKLGLDGDDFSHSEMEMDATSGIDFTR